MAVEINGRLYPSGEDEHTLTLTDDEMLILFELFERLEENHAIAFAHPAEWAALGRLTGQFESKLWQLFGKDPSWEQLLFEARTRRGKGIEAHIDGLGYVRVEDDGRVVEIEDPDAPKP